MIPKDLTENERMSAIGHVVSHLLECAGHNGYFTLVFDVGAGGVSSITNMSDPGREAALRTVLSQPPKRRYNDPLTPEELVQKVNSSEH